ncbi:MAG: hypothetical protein ACRDFX_07800 [Chloroflexota bacterium]
MSENNWRDELVAVQAACQEQPDLADEIMNTYRKRRELATTPLPALRPAKFTLLRAIVWTFAVLLAAIFVVSLLLRSPMGPVADAGLFVILVSIPLGLRTITNYGVDRRYLRDERQWLASATRPEIVTRTYGSDRGLQQDASRLARLGYAIAGQSRTWGGTKITFAYRRDPK